MDAQRSTKGRLLAARPDLLDPNFKQSLVFMIEHDGQGALGVVVNRPEDKTVGEMFPHESFPAEIAVLPAFRGGPVQPNTLIIGVFRWDAAGGRMSFQDESDPAQIVHALGQPHTWVRAFIGYSGWSDGQLEGELDGDAWTVCAPDPLLFEGTHLDNLWPAFSSGLDRWRSLMRHLPRNPEHN